MTITTETFIALSALAVSIIALVSGFISNKLQKSSFKDQVYQRFSQMWFDMDQVFIEHPEMHKYFYRVSESADYAPLNPQDPNYALGLCIAEMFSDVFQYSAPLEVYLSTEDRASYEDYKKMINNAPISKAAKLLHNWHEENA